ncbi:MAG: polysaccharide pyruvyl transferase family protein [Paludibacteraceae bacterium]|nr:polysaccharide pyruvyl transferase family protein [Paludibacteraceae bacterium]
MRRQSKIGILTWHYYANFGSALQAYALQYALQCLGLDVRIINYRNKKFNPRPMLYERVAAIVERVYRLFGLSSHKYGYSLFMQRYLRQTCLIRDEQKLLSLTKHFDNVIYGSDQIWAPNVFNPVYMGQYTSPSAVQLSYAASVGLPIIPNELKKQYQTLLSAMSHIAVREEAAAELIKKEFRLSSTTVLDPTLLVDASQYRQIATEVKGINKPYCLCYLLNANHTYAPFIEQYISAHDQHTMYAISTNAKDKSWANMLENISPDEFIWLVDNAESIITDSYHGTIFSMLFHKPVYLLQRFANDDPINQNSRIQQLQKYFYIPVYNSASILPLDPKYDYEQFDKTLARLKEQSLHYLQQALHTC